MERKEKRYFPPSAHVSDPFCKKNPKWDPLAWEQYGPCEPDGAGMVGKPCGSPLPEEVALFQGCVHFSMLSSMRDLRAHFTHSYLTSLLQIAIPVFIVDRV